MCFKGEEDKTGCWIKRHVETDVFAVGDKLMNKTRLIDQPEPPSPPLRIR